MANTIAEQYAEELESWIRTIHFYGSEINQLDSKLYELLTRNSVVGLAKKVDFYQVKLMNLSEKFDAILESIEEQEDELKADGKLLEDVLINYETERQQKDLREEMLSMEKRFAEVKFECEQFLTRKIKI